MSLLGSFLFKPPHWRKERGSRERKKEGEGRGVQITCVASVGFREWDTIKLLLWIPFKEFLAKTREKHGKDVRCSVFELTTSIQALPLNFPHVLICSFQTRLRGKQVPGSSLASLASSYGYFQNYCFWSCCSSLPVSISCSHQIFAYYSVIATEADIQCQWLKSHGEWPNWIHSWLDFLEAISMEGLKTYSGAREMTHEVRTLTGLAEDPHSTIWQPMAICKPSYKGIWSCLLSLYVYQAYMWCSDIYTDKHIHTY